MSLVILNNPTTAPTNTTQWERFLAREDVSNIGNGSFIRTFILSNWDSGTLKPVIKQGSIIEVGGSIYQADSDTAIVDDPGGLADGQIRIKLVPDSPTTPTSVNPYFVNDALPAWDAQKGGWYSSDDKYLPFEMTRASSGTVFSNKFEYDGPEALVKRYASGGVYFPGNTELASALSVAGGATIGGALSVSGETSSEGVNSGTDSFGLKWEYHTGTTSSLGEGTVNLTATGTVIGALAFVRNGNVTSTWYGLSTMKDVNTEGFIYIFDGGCGFRGVNNDINFGTQPYRVILFYI